MKREGYLSWDEYFMGIALLSAQRSKDPGTQVGACIVSGENKILSVGYNGMPTGCCDDSMPWDREGDPLATKYLFVCHAELNAILNQGGADLRAHGCIPPFSPAMNVPRRSFRPVSGRSFTAKTSMRIPTRWSPPKRCFGWRESLIAPICRAARP